MPSISGVTGSKGYAGISLRIPDDEPEYKGTTMVFAQATAPIGWTQVNVNDLTLRITSGGVTTGGANPFTSQYPATLYSFTEQTGEFIFNADTHYTTVAEMPAHIHYGHNSAFVTTSTTHALGPTAGYGLGSVHIPSPTSPAGSATPHNVLPYISPLGSPTSPGDGHSHSFTGGIKITSSATIDLRIKYISAIVATRNTLL